PAASRHVRSRPPRVLRARGRSRAALNARRQQPAATMRAVTRRDDDGTDGQPWHNRTPAVAGASIAGLAVIGLLVLAVSMLTRQFSAPEQAPLDFVEPSYSAVTQAATTTATTTATITTTSPPQTTDLSAIETTSTSETTSPPETTSEPETS